MISSGKLKFAIVWLCFTLLSVLGASAQQYVILQADYGYGNQRVDVTQRLKEIASRDTRFRMGNSTFGVDPAPGKVKTLRITARGAYGKTRVFEYREGSTVDGAQFEGWSGGNWGGGGGGGNWGGGGGYPGGGYPGGGYQGGDSGQFVIIHAEYGTERNHVDVTRRLRELARADRSFRMGNSTFDVDPDPGRVKTLRIYARGPNGGNRMFEFREGSTVDGSQFRGWGRGDWGNEGWNGGWNDGNNNYGDSGQFTIMRAFYGTSRNNVDVTNRLRQLASADTRFRMGNSTFGVDPDPGQVKVLRIFARGPNGGQRTFEYREGSTIDGSQFRGWGRGDWGRDDWRGRWDDRDRD
jgi:hypothetical protein